MTLFASNPATGTGPDDVVLVREVLSGDRSALDRFLPRLSCVVRFVYRLNRTLATRLSTTALEEVVQQVYAGVWEKLSEFRGSSALESWIFGFCRNCLRAESRRCRGEVTRSLEPEHLDRPDLGPGPAHDAGTSEGREQLHRELERLDLQEREVVRMRHLDGLSFEEIARQMDLPPSTVKDRCYRGLVRLKTRLRQHDVA